jgi:hypothetical protein
MIRWFFLLLAAVLVGCPAPAADDDDATVVPPDDDDDDFTRLDCEEDTECRFTSGLEICEENVCVEGDRNNSLQEAQLLDYDGTANLHIAPAGDVDWFRFNGTAGDLVSLRATAEDSGRLDTVIRYFDASGTEIAFNDDFERVASIAPDSWLLSGVESTGAWYLTVEDARGWIGDPANPPEGGEDYGYDIGIGRAGAGDWAFLDVVDGAHDDATDAWLWELETDRTNYSAGGFLESAGDTDWLEIPVVQGQTLRLYGFPNSGQAGVTRLTVYMPDGLTPITSIDGPGWSDDRRLWMPVLETGSYYVEVSDAAGGGGYDSWYWLHAAWNVPPEQEDPPLPAIVVEMEPNDADGPQDSGIALTGSGSQSVELWARINPAGDEDWYAIEAEAGDRITASFQRTEAAGETTRLAVELRNPAGDVVETATWNGEEEAVLSLTELDSVGTWHVVVSEQSPDAGSGGHYYGFTLGALRP